MGNQLIMLNSVTLATKAKNLLQSRGITAYVEKTPIINNSSSCGYSVFVPVRTDEAERLLIASGFAILGRTDRVVL